MEIVHRLSLKLFAFKQYDRLGCTNEFLVRGDLPSKTSAGVLPVMECGVFLELARKQDILVPILSPLEDFCRALFTDFTKFSAVPLDDEWYGGTQQ